MPGDGAEVEQPQLALVGTVLAAVRADLEALGALEGGARRSLAALALRLAEAIDVYGASAGPTATARLAQELRATLTVLTTERSDDDGSRKAFWDRMSTPVGDAEDDES